MAAMQMGAAAPATDPAADSSDDSGMDLSQGYVIEITVTPDGKITVGVESAADEQGEESQSDSGSAGGDDSGGDSDESDDDAQPVASFGEALRIAKDIYAHAGQITDSGAGQDEMSSGYGKGGM